MECLAVVRVLAVQRMIEDGDGQHVLFREIFVDWPEMLGAQLTSFRRIQPQTLG